MEIVATTETRRTTMPITFNNCGVMKFATRYLENPENPETELLDTLSERLQTITMIITPPCSAQTFQALLDNAPLLKRILVLDCNKNRLDQWHATLPSALKEKINHFYLTNIEDLDEIISSWLLDDIEGALLGRSALYIPRRFKRIEKEFSTQLEKVALREQQVICSSALYRTNREWRLTTNQISNITLVQQHTLVPFSNSTYPIVVTGAGPSLDKNITVLKAKQKSVFIIATDASVSSLLKEKIIPDCIVCLEDSHVVWRFFSNHIQELKNVPLVTTPSCTPILIEQYLGPIIFTNRQKNEKNCPFFESVYASLTPLETGQCVGHYGIHLAEYLTRGQIILVGMDFAFTGGNYHTKAICHESYEDSKNNMEILVKGAYEEWVVTSADLQNYLNYLKKYFRKQQKVSNIINATEGGALIPGVPHLSLNEALKDDALRDVPVFYEKQKDVESVQMCLKTLQDKLLQFKTSLQTVQESVSSLQKSASPCNPFSILELNTPIWQTISSCCNTLLFAEYFLLLKNYNTSIFPQYKEKAYELYTDIEEAVHYLEILLKFKTTSWKGLKNNILLLDNGTNLTKTVKKMLSSKNNLTILEEKSSLRSILECIWKENIGTIMFFNGNALPEMWSIPNIKGIDIKTEKNKQVYEAHFWSKNYSIAVFDDELGAYWNNIAPCEINCNNIETLIIS